MVKYLITNRNGRSLLIGIAFLIAGFIFENTVKAVGIVCFLAAMVFFGYEITKESIVSTIRDKKPNVDLLMILAAIGACLINYYSEAAMLLFIFAGAEVLEEFVSSKSSNAIKELLNHVPDKANLIKEDGSIVKVDTEELKIGDRISVSKGDQLPIDGYLESDALINETSMTGESMPVEKKKGEEALAGTLNEGDAFVIEVSKLKKDTLFSNIIRMVDEAQSKPSRKEQLIDTIEHYYVIGVLIAVPLFIAILYYVTGLSFTDAFYRGMVLLTVASPCALVASATPSSLSAISNSARNGILFNKAKSIESLKDLDLLLTDKTGTLTNGQFEIVDYECPEDVLKSVVYLEQNSNHPIAESIVHRFEDLDLSQVDKTVKIEEIAGNGLKMGYIIVAKAKYFEGFEDPNNYLAKKEAGTTISFIGKGNKLVGYFAFEDTVRESVKETVDLFKGQKIDLVMLTGDNEKVAKYVSDSIGLNGFVANCYPADKLNYIEANKGKYKMIAMIGDGINDAPALANADIGISMGSGSSIAMESSDFVVVKNDLSKIFHSYKLSQKLNSIIIQNIVFSIAVIVALITLNVLGKLDLPSGVVFHEGSTILVILNGLRLLNFKVDK